MACGRESLKRGNGCVEAVPLFVKFGEYLVNVHNGEAERKCGQIRLRAERKAGSLLREMKQNGTRAQSGERKQKQMSDGATFEPKTLPELGVTRDQSSEWQQLADIPEQEFEAEVSKPGRIVAKVEHHLGELFPRVGFIVTNMTLPSRSVVRFYNKRGTAEQWIKEGKQATHWTRLSCHRFRANEVRLQLSVLAYNLGNLWRRLGLPHRIKSWSLTSLQHRLMKTGGRLVKHARYYWLLLAEGYLNRRLFGDMLRRIWALPVPGG